MAPLTFICTTGTDYTTIRCKTCGQPWVFNKQLAISAPLAVEGKWECPFCKRGHIQVKE